LWRGRRPPRRGRKSRTLHGRRALNAGRALQSGHAEPVRSCQRRGGLRRYIRLLRLACAWRQAGLRRLSRARRHTRSRQRARLLLSLAVRRARLLLLTGPVQLTGLLLSWAVRHARQRQLTGLSRQTILSPLSGQTVWPLLAGLQLPDRPVRIDEAGIGAAEFALLEHKLAADILRRVKLTHKPLVAQHHLRRNRQRYRGEARAARARADGESARALRQKT